MTDNTKNEQSFRRSGNSVFYKRLLKVPHPFLKLLLPAVLILCAFILYKTGNGCIIKRISGIPCPMCGMTRAYLALFSGDIAAAFRLHFMFPAVPVLYLYVWFDGKPFRNSKLNSLILCLILAGFLIHWLAAVFGF